MTDRQQDVIDFLRAAYKNCGESQYWILRDIAAENRIKISGWDRENQCPMFTAMPTRPCFGKRAYTEMMIEEGWRNAN